LHTQPRAAWTLGVFLALTGLAVVFSPGPARALARLSAPPGPDRYTTILIEYTEYEWWLAAWEDNEFQCRILVDHEGQPTAGEIQRNCGETLYRAWLNTQPCPASDSEAASCPGHYIYFVTSRPAQREIGVALPPPQVWLSLPDCYNTPSSNICERTPRLRLTGEEPLPNQEVLRIEGIYDGQEFSCGPVCDLALKPSGEAGAPLEFWAYSSYGDSSQVFSAQVRVLPFEDGNPEYRSWYVDVLSPQWAGPPLPSCAAAWEAFPPVGGLPTWLQTPSDPAALATNIPYEYLAGNLISQGAVDASSCPDEGLLPNGASSPCGLEAAREAVAAWQNRFDSLIVTVAQDTGIPAQLLKNLFSRESQFWPGVFKDNPEVGLGQLTEHGADATLLWNISFYEQFCPLVLDANVCQRGYTRLQDEHRRMLRGALVHSVDAFCADCPLGLDLTKADFSVGIFAETLLANCGQAGRLVRNATASSPGHVAGYEDLWRFTLVNYNAGPGCLYLAVNETHKARQPLTWENVSARLTPVCQGAIEYVKDISR
jgi:hypothetical protein